MNGSIQDSTLRPYLAKIAKMPLLKASEELSYAKELCAVELNAWELVLGVSDLRPVIVKGIKSLLREFPPSLMNELLDGKSLEKMPVKLRKEDPERYVLDYVERYIKEGTRPLKHKNIRQFMEAMHVSRHIRMTFFNANVRLVVKFSLKYKRIYHMELADLIQEGNMGLMRAIGRFDFKKKLRFSTYAVWWIRHAVGRYLANNNRIIRVPVHTLDSFGAVAKSIRKLSQQFGREPTIEEIAEDLKIAPLAVDKLMRANMQNVVSLDNPVMGGDPNGESSALIDFIEDDRNNDPVEHVDNPVLEKTVDEILEMLTPTEAVIIMQRFGLRGFTERTYHDIGIQFDLSRERIRQLQNRALLKVQKVLKMKRLTPAALGLV